MEPLILLVSTLIKKMSLDPGRASDRLSTLRYQTLRLLAVSWPRPQFFFQLILALGINLCYTVARARSNAIGVPEL